MPMTTEQATVGGRETYGEPKKIGAVAIDVDGDHVHAHIERHGLPARRGERHARRADRHRPARQDRLLLQAQPVARRQGLRHRARRSCTSTATRKRATAGPSTARSTLHDSPIDPIVDIPIGRIVSMRVRAGDDDAAGRGGRARAGRLAAAVRAPALRRPVGAREEGLMSDRATATSSSRPTRTPGFPCEEYRPYLDPRYTEQFDAFLAERHAMRDEQMKLNYDYITQWETTHEEGLRGAFDAEQRDKEMDADGVVGRGHLPRRGLDHRDGVTALRRRPVRGDDRRSGAGVRGRPRPQPVPRRSLRDEPGAPGRRRPRADLPRHRAFGRGDRVARRQARHPRRHDPDDVARPHALQRPRPTTRCGPRARPRASRCTRTPARRRARR